MKITASTLSRSGGRPNNDDTALLRLEGGSAWVYVGDGLGAYAGGRQASLRAGETLMEGFGRGSMLEKEALQKACAAADTAVKQLQQQTGGSMKTTLVFLAVEDGRARWAHVGDSRLYHFRKDRLLSQTTDHSVSQMAVFMGEITSREIRFHEDRNRVLRALGGETARPELSEVTALEEGDAFLLCTDGFWEYVYEEEMESTLQQAASPEAWLERMEQLLTARVHQDNDNYTAAAVFCGKAASGKGLLKRLFGKA